MTRSAGDDDFYQTNDHPQDGLSSRTWASINLTPVQVLVTIVLTLILFAITTRMLSERPSRQVNPNAKTVQLLPYWFPYLGHGISILQNPQRLLTIARDQSNGVFALNLGSRICNVGEFALSVRGYPLREHGLVIDTDTVSDPAMAESLMSQKESILQSRPFTWALLSMVFGVPRSSKPKYEKIWPELESSSSFLFRSPQLDRLLRPTLRYLEENIPQMISFMDNDIDLQPWERSSRIKYISESEVEIDLMSLMKDILGHASIAAVFGRGLLDKYPTVLHDIDEMEDGLIFFLLGLPSLTPWPGVFKAHLARRRLWNALDNQQRALDEFVDGNDVDHSWGDLSDVSEMIMTRHKLFKENGFQVKERGDLSVLWALVTNATTVAYWHLLHILSTPSLLSDIRAEIAPYAMVSKPVSIGQISEAPKLSLSSEGLSRNCPLFKATYLESLRLSSQPWAVRKVASNLEIPPSEGAIDQSTYAIKSGEHIVVPYGRLLRDPKYFPNPDKFSPERFLVHNADGTLSINPGLMRSFGEGSNMFPGGVFAERECLAVVAGVLSLWEFEPMGKGWVVPDRVGRRGVSLPKVDTRVRVKKRIFNWNDQL